ncbi:hypothetical protein OCU04_004900 [Sclerotinia nivalis]|uniref:Uncharacterized protein n=1 Tax=Sclerotinia nivalis TaxID=352851 RepID=A0A9X0DMG3_9HELO|nr:hypothetical protein OCU04_004900 [Sclerotinia nivalis]
MIFPRFNRSTILQLLLILTLTTFAQGGRAKTKTKSKDKFTTRCVYQTPIDYAINPAATKSRYTVTVTSGGVVSTPTYGKKWNSPTLMKYD